MLTRILQAAAAAGMLASPIVGTAHAQNLAPPPSSLDPGYYAPPGPVYEGRSAAGGDRICIKLCENDTNPCDPIEYKRSDGRCSSGDGL